MSSVLVHISGQRKIVTKKDNLVFISHGPTSPPAQSGGSLSPEQEQDLADSTVHILLVDGENPHNTTHASLSDKGTLTHAQLESSLAEKESAGTAQGLVVAHEATHPAPTVRDSRSQVAGSYEQAGEAAVAVAAHEAKTNDNLHPQYKIAGSAPATHADSHTGADSIRDSTSSAKGLATGQQITALEANTAKLSTIEDEATADQTGAEIKSLYEGEGNTNPFTDAEKSKVSALESSKFLGTYVDLSALIATHPSPVEGSYAHVDSGVGEDVSVYIWDFNDTTYLEQAGASTSETAASIKSKYESNPDTNAFTDSEKTNLSNQSNTNTGDQDLSGKENVGTAQGLVTTHETVGVHEADKINLPTLPGATCTDLQCLIDSVQSSGYVAGGLLSDAGGGLVGISLTRGYIRATDDLPAQLLSFNVAEHSGIVVPELSTVYIYVDYNGGVPVHAQTLDPGVLEQHDKIPLGSVWRQGTLLHIIPGGLSIADIPRTVQKRLNGTQGAIVRDNGLGGLILGETGVRNVTMSAGRVFSGLTLHPLSEINTSGVETFYVFNSEASSAPDQSGVSQYDNLSYWDGSALSPLTVNKYGSRFFYVDYGGHLVMQYGVSNSVSIAIAETEPIPEPPGILKDFAIYLGRIVIQAGAATASVITSSFGSVEMGSVITTHNDLSGVQGDGPYHLAQAVESDLTDPNAQLSDLHTDGAPSFADLEIVGAPIGRVRIDGSSGNAAFLELVTNGTEYYRLIKDSSGFSIFDGPDGDVRFHIKTDGNVGIGTFTQNSKFEVKGSGISTGYTAKFYDSGATKSLFIRDDGLIEFRNWSLPLPDGTAGQVLGTNGAGATSWVDGPAPVLSAISGESFIYPKTSITNPFGDATNSPGIKFNVNNYATAVALVSTSINMPMELPKFTVPAGAVSLKFTFVFEPESGTNWASEDIVWKMQYKKMTDNVAWSAVASKDIGTDTAPASGSAPQLYEATITLAALGISVGDIIQAVIFIDSSTTFASKIAFEMAQIEAA